MDLVVARQSACGCVDHRDCDRVVVPVDVGWLSFYELALVVWCCCLFELVADLLCLELRWSSFVVAWMSCVQFVCCMFITELIETSPCADLYLPILFSLCLDDPELSLSWCVWFGVGMIFVAVCCCVSWLVVAAFLQVISRQNGFLPFVLLMLQRRRGSYCFDARRVRGFFSVGCGCCSSWSWVVVVVLHIRAIAYCWDPDWHVSVGRRGCSFLSSCTLRQTAHNLLRFGVCRFLFAMLIAHSRSFCLCWTVVLIF